MNDKCPIWKKTQVHLCKINTVSYHHNLCTMIIVNVCTLLLYIIYKNIRVHGRRPSLPFFSYTLVTTTWRTNVHVHAMMVHTCINIHILILHCIYMYQVTKGIYALFKWLFRNALKDSYLNLRKEVLVVLKIVLQE